MCVCVQARRHKEVADRKVEELQLQLTHLQDLLSKLKDNKATTVSNCNHLTEIEPLLLCLHVCMCEKDSNQLNYDR